MAQLLLEGRSLAPHPAVDTQVPVLVHHQEVLALVHHGQVLYSSGFHAGGLQRRASAWRGGSRGVRHWPHQGPQGRGWEAADAVSAKRTAPRRVHPRGPSPRPPLSSDRGAAQTGRSSLALRPTPADTPAPRDGAPTRHGGLFLSGVARRGAARPPRPGSARSAE